MPNVYHIFKPTIQERNAPPHAINHCCHSRRGGRARATDEAIFFIHSAHPLHHFYFPPYEGGIKGGL